MRIIGLRSILAGACLLLQMKVPLAVIADTAEISITELDAFIQANAASIVRFQDTMREVFFLWDENRTRGDQPDIPLTLDTLRNDLRKKVHQLIVISDEDPVSSQTVFKAYGFAGNPVPKNNPWDWDDTPTNRILYPILKMLEESASARHAFWGFFRWSNSHLGLLHWFSVFADQGTDPEWVAPKLFGGSIFNYRGVFVYDTDKRASDHKQLNTYLLILDTMVNFMKHLNTKTFRMGPKLDLGADVKFLFEDIIKVVTRFREGVRRVRDAYVAIPPLPGVDYTDVEEDTSEKVGVSKIPKTLQKKVLSTPEYIEGTKILKIPEFQFEPPDGSPRSEYGLLKSLPAYVETDFDLLSVPVCSFEEEMADMQSPQDQLRCNIF
ncbi:hypothetical protein TWF718_005975 [Orbilia javanica]|uniref:Uncharacterized protein n=1 Tax=Orbilia javanica TaxID=47235 RepID=A0AAN8RPA7_9PEZI